MTGGRASACAGVSFESIDALWEAISRLIGSPWRTLNSLSFWVLAALENAALHAAITARTPGQIRLRRNAMLLFTSTHLFPSVERALTAVPHDRRLWGMRLLEVWMRGRELNAAAAVTASIPLPPDSVWRALEPLRRHWNPDVREAVAALTDRHVAASAELCHAATAAAVPPASGALVSLSSNGNGFRPSLSGAVPALRRSFGKDNTSASSSTAAAAAATAAAASANGGAADGDDAEADAGIELWFPPLSTPAPPIDEDMYSKPLDAFANTIIGGGEEPDSAAGGMGGFDDEPEGIRDYANNGNWSDEEEEEGSDKGDEPEEEDVEAPPEEEDVEDDSDSSASEEDAAAAAGADADAVPREAGPEEPHRPLPALPAAAGVAADDKAGATDAEAGPDAAAEPSAAVSGKAEPGVSVKAEPDSGVAAAAGPPSPAANGDKAADKAADKASDKAADKASDKAGDKASDKAGDKAAGADDPALLPPDSPSKTDVNPDLECAPWAAKAGGFNPRSAKASFSKPRGARSAVGRSLEDDFLFEPVHAAGMDDPMPMGGDERMPSASFGGPSSMPTNPNASWSGASGGGGGGGGGGIYGANSAGSASFGGGRARSRLPRASAFIGGNNLSRKPAWDPQGRGQGMGGQMGGQMGVARWGRWGKWAKMGNMGGQMGRPDGPP
eukprot:TRINITY_DN1502_c0_g1_i5.p1 TRINITY_DN1502_c0_g1~~TRINITY_DN1502_c0_g1_i5.p1  ORF type:complete len:726 (+),score=292.98 TRINITY_DN1502_c0_g1_i5:164-2179(+)